MTPAARNRRRSGTGAGQRLDLAPDRLAEELLLAPAQLSQPLRRHVAEDAAQDVVVPQAESASELLFAERMAQSGEQLAPCVVVERRGVDEHAVHIPQNGLDHVNLSLLREWLQEGRRSNAKPRPSAAAA